MTTQREAMDYSGSTIEEVADSVALQLLARGSRVVIAGELLKWREHGAADAWASISISLADAGYEVVEIEGNVVLRALASAGPVGEAAPDVRECDRHGHIWQAVSHGGTGPMWRCTFCGEMRP